MAAIGKALVAGSLIDDAAAAYYTATNVAARIDKCTVCNTSGGSETFTLYLVQSSGSVDSSNTVIDTRPVNAGETYTCPEVVGHWLTSGESLWAVASDPTALDLRVSGIEVT